MIFRAELAALVAKHGARLELIHRLDAEQGLTSRPEVERAHASIEQADAYLCGPGPFMELVEQALLARGHSRDHLWIERFEGVGEHERDHIICCWKAILDLLRGKKKKSNFIIKN